MASLTVYPAVGRTVYAADLVTVITSVGAVIDPLPEASGVPYVPEYYQRLIGRGLLLTYNPLGDSGGPPVTLPVGTSGDASASEPPTSGTYAVGARVWNSAPAAGQPAGWVCATAGTPGTWLPFATIGSAVVASTPVRLVVLGIGESGMVGYGVNSGLPAGYPPAAGPIKVFDDTFSLVDLAEPVERVVTPVDAVLSEQGDALAPGVGYMGMTTWRLHNSINPQHGTIYVPCGRSGSSSEQWAPSRLRTSRYGATLARMYEALDRENATLGLIVFDHGRNDILLSHGTVNWQTNWTTIVARLRADIGFSGTLLYPRFPTTVPAYPQADPAKWPTLIAQQNALQGAVSGVYAVPEPNGPWSDSTEFHLDTPAEIVLSQDLAAAYAAHPTTLVAPDYTGTALPAGIAVLSRWDAASGVTRDGSDRVSAWLPTGTTAAASTQATAGKQPLYVAAQQNGLPCIRFANSRQDTLVSSASPLAAAMSNAAPYTVYIVCKQQVASGFGVVLGAPSAAGDDFIWLGFNSSRNLIHTRVLNGSALGTLTGSAAYTAGQLTISSHVYDGAEMDMTCNGKALGGAAAGSVTTLADVAIGSVVGVAFFDGDIFEIIVCSGAHSIAQRVAVQMALRNKYGAARPA